VDPFAFGLALGVELSLFAQAFQGSERGYTGYLKN
jgi:hypothetical protein